MASARQIKRAQILLKSDQRVNWTYDQISKAFDVSAVTIARVRKTFVEQGMDETLQRKKSDREYAHVLDGDGEAHLIALACSEPRQAETVQPQSVGDNLVSLRSTDFLKFFDHWPVHHSVFDTLFHPQFLFFIYITEVDS